MNKSELAYSFNVEPDPGGGWIIWFPELPGCSGWSERIEDVGSEAKVIARIWLEMERERQHPVPRPLDYQSQEKWSQGNDVSVDDSGPLIGVPDMAKLLGVSPRRVQALAKERGVGRRFGNYLVFAESDIERLRPRSPGRPSRSKRIVAAAD
jgi:predicted RNase H-like HicB family nuclease